MLIQMFLVFYFFYISVAGQVPIEHLNRRDTGISTPVLDESLLAVQVGGIIGAYVIFVAILLSLLLFVGRRLRRAVQISNYSLQVEMMRPAKPPISLDPSPVTPSSTTFTTNNNRSWTSFGRGLRSHISGNGSVATIDESVVASDRQKAQDDLEKLYAAVMEHDERKAAEVEGRQDNQTESPDSVQTNPFTDPSSSISDRLSLPHIQPPMSPRMQPPKSPQMKAPMSPRSSRLSKISPMSLFTSNSRTSANSSKLRSPISLRKLSISSPLSSPDATATDSYGEDQPPLTPRMYNPGPPPTAPLSKPSPVKTPGTGRAPAPAPLSLSTTNHNSPVNGSSSLPFRDAYPLQSAPATKTTILERPTHLKPGIRTGVPTPYSPYMPFTPVTPLTPSRVVTRRQRKKEMKENGLRVLTEDDLVKDAEDMW
ncbi:hypothetical protein PHISCL_08795 [Aspergillus sclerotialis]|uniref:Uncharacterized protein n=1 Tax=Aspergillus sclerotialis TaxID=2070753 RepID=A0A3A2Z899_9EURO|nr:hypothetical protein PHISCL_08795 [Aspergillus sclerotialis]